MPRKGAKGGVSKNQRVAGLRVGERSFLKGYGAQTPKNMRTGIIPVLDENGQPREPRMLFEPGLAPDTFEVTTVSGKVRIYGRVRPGVYKPLDQMDPDTATVFKLAHEGVIQEALDAPITEDDIATATEIAATV